MPQKVIIFQIKERISSSHFQDLLDCLPARSTILTIRADYYSMLLNVFVYSEHFIETPSNEIPPTAIPITILEIERSKMEWRWCK